MVERQAQMEKISKPYLSRRKFIKSSTASAATIGIAGCTGAGDSDNLELSLAAFVPEDHAFSPFMNGFIDEVENIIGDEVDLEVFYGGELGDPEDHLELAQSETVDIAQTATAYHDNEIPLSTVSNLPGHHTTSAGGGDAYFDILFEDIVDLEWDNIGVKPLSGLLQPPIQYIGNVETLSTNDWEGQIIAVPGSTEEAIAVELGASTERISAANTYPAFERGSIDGTLMNVYALESYSWHEVVDYATTNAALGGAANALVISNDRFETLPENIQQGLIEAGQEAIIPGSEALDDLDSDIANQYDDITYEVPEDNLEQWYEDTERVGESWIESADDPETAEEIKEKWENHF